MANNPFDPPIVQVKKTLDRGGIASANRGFGSIAAPSLSSRPAPGPENLSELDDVDGSVLPQDGDALFFDSESELWTPGEAFRPDLSTPPTYGQTLVWNGTAWVPGSSGGGGGDVTQIAMTDAMTTSRSQGTSSSSYAFKGEGFIPVVDVKILRVYVMADMDAGKTYAGAVVRDSGSDTIAASWMTETVVPVSNGIQGHWLDFTVPVEIVADGTTWFLCSGCTDAGDTHPYKPVYNNQNFGRFGWPSPSVNARACRIADQGLTPGHVIDRNADSSASWGVGCEWARV